jgi:hypothetical protein
MAPIFNISYRKWRNLHKCLCSVNSVSCSVATRVCGDEEPGGGGGGMAYRDTSGKRVRHRTSFETMFPQALRISSTPSLFKLALEF